MSRFTYLVEPIDISAKELMDNIIEEIEDEVGTGLDAFYHVYPDNTVAVNDLLMEAINESTYIFNIKML